MNRDVLAGSWKELRGQVKQRWGKLTDDDMTQIEGSLERLIGSIQKRYGYAREQAEREIDEFLGAIRSKKETAEAGGPSGRMS